MADGTASPATDAPTQEALIKKAKSLIEPFRARAGEAEKNRRLHRETHEEMHAAGLYKVQMPARYGGFELDPEANVLRIRIGVGVRDEPPRHARHLSGNRAGVRIGGMDLLQYRGTERHRRDGIARGAGRGLGRRQ